MPKPEMQLTVDGLTLSYSSWEEKTGIVANTIRWRARNGWTPRQAVGYDPPPPARRTNHRKPGSWARPNLLTEFSPVPLIETTVVRVDDKAIGQQCRRLRRTAGIPARLAAEAMGVSISAVFHMEGGKRRFTQELLDRFNQIAAGWVVTLNIESQSNE